MTNEEISTHQKLGLDFERELIQKFANENFRVQQIDVLLYACETFTAFETKLKELFYQKTEGQYRTGMNNSQFELRKLFQKKTGVRTILITKNMNEPHEIYFEYLDKLENKGNMKFNNKVKTDKSIITFPVSDFQKTDIEHLTNDIFEYIKKENDYCAFD